MNNGKIRLLALEQFFKKYTDEDNIFSATEICDYLSQKGISCERKALYSDIDALRDCGMDIICSKSPKKGFFLATTDFEEAEIRLMLDAVQAAKFITPKKSELLVGKISDLLNVDKADKLKSQVYVNCTYKQKNEEIYYTIDTLNKAILCGKQVKFTYTHINIADDGRLGKSQRQFVVNPYALIWSEDRYYLVCNNPDYDNLMHTRLDRMSSVVMIDAKARHFSHVSKYKESFDSADYSSKLFNMFSGEEQKVRLRCSDSLLEVIVEKFGTDIEFEKINNTNFEISVKAVTGEGFISWLLQHGSDVEIVSPKSLRKTLAARIKSMLELYSD